ncbi:MAG: ribonuclease E/G [Dongiaceae bacterium]
MLDGDDGLVEFHRENEGDDTRVGDIYLGRIVRVDHGLGAAFVDVGRKQAAFLPLSDIPGPAVEGARTVIQIEREGLAGKGPKATARPVLAGVRLVLSPGRRAIGLSGRIADKAERARLSALAKGVAEEGEGITVRASAIGADESQVRDEAAMLRGLWRDLLDRQRSQQPPAILQRQLPIDLRLLRDLGPAFEAAIYDHRGAADIAKTWCRTAMGTLAPRIEFQGSSEWRPAPAEMLENVESAVQPRIMLKSGGSISIEPTEAMTVIDVNAESAGTTRVNDQGERLLLQTNLAAAEEIARQIRLRNIGGIIVVDFIDLRDVAARRQVVDRLRATTALDSATVWIGAMSRLGLVELTRKRRGPTLLHMLTRPCPACEGTGRVMNDDRSMRAMDAG